MMLVRETDILLDISKVQCSRRSPRNYKLAREMERERQSWEIIALYLVQQKNPELVS